MGQQCLAVYVAQDNDRWTDSVCCGVTAMVDASQKISEADEGNNKLSLPTVRVRDHR